MPSFEEIQKARIANSFNTDEGLSELTKAEILDIEKGGKRAMIGEKRTFAGREYIKTADGWKFHGKGTGSKAQSHVAGALEHHVGEKREGDIETEREALKDKINEARNLFAQTKPRTWKYEEAALKLRAAEKQLKEFETKNPKEEVVDDKPTHKDATDHFVEENGKHYIDTLDPDTGEKKFKPGDKVKYIDDNGKHHKGTISDREHEDGDMFEVDREDVANALKTIDGLYGDFDGNPSESQVKSEIKKLKDAGLNSEQIKVEIDKQTKMTPYEKRHFYGLLS